MWYSFPKCYTCTLCTCTKQVCPNTPYSISSEIRSLKLVTIILSKRNITSLQFTILFKILQFFNSSKFGSCDAAHWKSLSSKINISFHNDPTVTLLMKQFTKHVREAYYKIKERRDTKQYNKQKLLYFISQSSKLILFCCHFRCRKVKGRNFKSQLAKAGDSKKTELKIKVGFSKSLSRNSAKSRKNLIPVTQGTYTVLSDIETNFLFKNAGMRVLDHRIS